MSANIIFILLFQQLINFFAVYYILAFQIFKYIDNVYNILLTIFIIYNILHLIRCIMYYIRYMHTLKWL